MDEQSSPSYQKHIPVVLCEFGWFLFLCLNFVFYLFLGEMNSFSSVKCVFIAFTSSGLVYNLVVFCKKYKHKALNRVGKNSLLFSVPYYINIIFLSCFSI